jgi:lipopolysaccharide heptosyltransferase II
MMNTADIRPAPINLAAVNGSSMKDAWATARRILCVRLDNMGDVLMTTPAIRALKAGLKDRHITLLASPAGEAVARMVPDVDAVITFDAPWMKGTGSGERKIGVDRDRAVRALVRAGRFDAAVIFTAYSQSPLPAAYFCYLAGIPLRLAHCRENPYDMLTDWVAETEPAAEIRHEVQRQLDLVAAVGCHTADQRLSFAVRDATCREIRRLLGAQGLDFGRPWVLVHTGATAESRRYPSALFAQAIRLLADAGCQIVLAGTAREIPAVAEIQGLAGVPSLSVAGQLDLAGLGAATLLADVVVSNNSGPAHLAAAIGTPLVDLYALTNPQHTPWMVRHTLLYHEVPCKFCYKSVCPQGHHACLRRVEPSRVAEAVIALLPFGMRALIADTVPARTDVSPLPGGRPRVPFHQAPCAGSGS